MVLPVIVCDKLVNVSLQTYSKIGEHLSLLNYSHFSVMYRIKNGGSLHVSLSRMSDHY